MRNIRYRDLKTSVILILILFSPISVAQDDLLDLPECMDYCYDPELQIKKGDSFTWKFTNSLFSYRGAPSPLSSVKITVIEPLNGLSASVEGNEASYLKVIASFPTYSSNESEEIIKETPISQINLPIVLLTHTMINRNGVLVNQFEAETADTPNWETEYGYGIGITAYWGFSVGRRVINSSIYTYTEYTRVTATNLTHTTVTYNWINYDYEVMSGLLLNYNLTSMSEGGIINTILIELLESTGDLEINLELLAILGGIVSTVIIAIIIGTYYLRKREQAKKSQLVI